MFGSKTTRLLGDVDRLKHKGRYILAIKPKIDVRYSHSNISSHNGGTLEAHTVSHAEDIYSLIDDRDDNIHKVIAVDEAFMINGSGSHLIDLFTKGHTVLVSSLQLSSSYNEYAEIMMMMPYATSIEVCPAVCSTCGADAYYTKKIGGRSDHEIEVGGSEMYKPTCASHFHN